MSNDITKNTNRILKRFVLISISILFIFCNDTSISSDQPEPISPNTTIEGSSKKTPINLVQPPPQKEQEPPQKEQEPPQKEHQHPQKEQELPQKRQQHPQKEQHRPRADEEQRIQVGEHQPPQKEQELPQKEQHRPRVDEEQRIQLKEQPQTQNEYIDIDPRDSDASQKLPKSKEIPHGEFLNWNTEKIVKWLDTINLDENDKVLVIQTLSDNTLNGADLLEHENADELYNTFGNAVTKASCEQIYNEIDKIKKNLVSNVLNIVPKLKNLRNTCFINAVVQCLLKIPALIKSISSILPDSSSSMLNEFIKLYYEIESDKSKVISLEGFDSLLRKLYGVDQRGTQGDSLTVLTHFLDQLEMDFKQKRVAEKLRDNYGIDYKQTLKCLICGYSEEINGIRQDNVITLPLKKNNLISISLDNDNYQFNIFSYTRIKTLKYKLYRYLEDNRKDISLNNINQISIKYSTNKEFSIGEECEQLVNKQNVFVMVDGKFITNLKINKQDNVDNVSAGLKSLGINTTVVTYSGVTLKCNCSLGKSEAFEITNEIKENPNTLILVIDRSVQSIVIDRSVQSILKDSDSPYSYPEKLNFYGDNYTLHGVLNHSGSLKGGHYWSFVRTADNKWYNASDTSINQININDVINKKTAMILFYIKDN